MISLSDGTKVKVEWKNPNSPVLIFTKDEKDHTIHLSKIDVKHISQELQSFVRFYQEDFSIENIDKVVVEHDPT